MKNGKAENKHQLETVTLNKQKNHLAVVLKRLMMDSKSQLNGNFARTLSFFCFPFSLQERTRSL